MKLRVVTWNAEGMFVVGSMTRRATPNDAVMTLKKLDAAIAVIPEFGIIADIAEQTDVAIRALGYECVTMAYADPRARGSGLAILSRYPIITHEIVRLGEVKGMVDAQIDVNGTVIHVIGVHLDDRSEEYRLREVSRLVAHIQSLGSATILMMGDFNAMKSTSRFAKVARGQFGRALEQLTAHKKLKSVVARVREMALGTTIEQIEMKTPLRSLDPGLKRTISARQRGLELLPAMRLAKIDWIFGSSNVTTRAYCVFPDVGSDHRPVAADVDINQ